MVLRIEFMLFRFGISELVFEFPGVQISFATNLVRFDFLAFKAVLEIGRAQVWLEVGRVLVRAECGVCKPESRILPGWLRV